MKTIVDMSLEEAQLLTAFRLLSDEQRKGHLLDIVERSNPPTAREDDCICLAADEMLLVLRLRAIKPELRADAIEMMRSASYQVQPIPTAPIGTEESYPDPDPAEQWAKFLVGFMALQGVLDAGTDEQNLTHTFHEALDAAAHSYDAMGYESMRELCHYAEWGRRREYRPGCGERSYIEID